MTIAVDAYEVSLRERGLAGATVARARAHLERLLGIEANGHRPLAWLTPRRAADLYAAARAGAAVDTHRNALAAGKAFGRYAAEQRWIAGDPFAVVKGVGRRRRGKPQLHITEALELMRVCVEERTRESAAVAASLLLGLAASEVAQRQVRDLDDAGRVLHITRGKNAYRVRSIEVPDELRPLLLELVRGRAGAAPLFGCGELDRPSRYWVYYHCKRLCAVARVPLVAPHGLRGTHSTIALGAVATSRDVATAIAAAGAGLGHAPGSPITASTYVAPGALAAARQRVAMRVLQGGRAGNTRAARVTSGRSGAEKLSANGGTRTPTVLPTGT